MRPKERAGMSSVVIRPTHGWGFPDFAELWQARELVYFLVWRDVKARYKQALLGVAWVVFRPIAMVTVFSLFFGRLLDVPSGNVPYPVFAFAGLLPWSYFSASLSRVAGSLVVNQNLLKKVYVPRLAIPIGGILSGLIDTGISFVVLIGAMLLYRVPLTARALMVLPLLALAAVTALGFGLWLGSLNVRYRDVGHLVPFIVQIWMYMTPVIYPSSLIPESLRFLLALNPMTLVVEGMRWALLGQSPATVTEPGLLALSMGTVGLVLLTGLLFFHRVEKSFADVV
jgi:lipopolysaccharide transport system permease protein